MSAERLDAIAARLEAAVSRLESCKGGAGGAAPAEGEPAAFVEAYDEIVAGKVARFLALSKEIGGDVETQAAMVEAGYTAVRAVLVTASKCKQPSAAVLQSLLKPISDQISAAQSFREKNRGSAFFNHLSAISESIPALGWVSITPKPGPYVKEMSDAGQFYTNRVLKDYKEKDQKHVDWVKAYLGAMVDIVAYIKQHHTTGVAWNRQGAEAKADAVAAAPAAAPAAPKPAPAAAASSGGDDKARAGLFAALNQGGGVTSGLKKVSKDQMTHKNPELRGSSVVKAKETTTTSAPKATAAAIKKTPVFALQGNKWCVEFQENNREIVIEETATRQVIYIYKCNNSTIQVKGKVNNITLDGCKKTAVVFGDVIAGLDIINCQSVQAQVTGATPLVNIDKTDGAQVYLSKPSIAADIVTAKCSEINISVPKNDEGEYTECALPEQFKNKWNGKCFTTEPTEIAA